VIPSAGKRDLLDGHENDADIMERFFLAIAETDIDITGCLYAKFFAARPQHREGFSMPAPPKVK
jgi:hypothetical protein